MRVGVVVADQQDVGIAGAGRVGGEPVHQLGRGVDAHLIAVALSIASIGHITGRAFALEVVDIHDEDRAGGIDLEGLRQRRAAARGAVAAVDEGDRVQHGRLPDGRDHCRACRSCRL